jgi:hypothetical protein
MAVLLLTTLHLYARAAVLLAKPRVKLVQTVSNATAVTAVVGNVVSQKMQMVRPLTNAMQILLELERPRLEREVLGRVLDNPLPPLLLLHHHHLELRRLVLQALEVLTRKHVVVAERVVALVLPITVVFWPLMKKTTKKMVVAPQMIVALACVLASQQVVISFKLVKNSNRPKISAHLMVAQRV